MPPAPAASDIKALIADDHTMVRTGLQMMLHLELGIKNIAEATTCATVMSSLRAGQPTHLIIDIVFKDGNSLEILPTIISLHPKLLIMVYSMMPTEVYLPVLNGYGINHYLSKSASPKDTSAALRTFFFNNTPPLPASPAGGAKANVFERLSPRELEVLHYLLRGQPNAAIAQALNLHKNTVATLKNRIMEKAEVRHMKDLFELAALYDIFS